VILCSIINARVPLYLNSQLLHRNIDVVERKPSVNAFGGGSVVVKSKDFSVLTLDISATEDFNNVADSIEALCNVGMLNE